MPKGKGYKSMGGDKSQKTTNSSKQEQTEDGTFYKDSIKTEGMGLAKEKNLNLYHD